MKSRTFAPRSTAENVTSWRPSTCRSAEVVHRIAGAGEDPRVITASAAA
jgi:hypothetical protein